MSPAMPRSSIVSRLGLAALIAVCGPTHADEFPGENLGAIPDDDNNGRTITFNASGLVGEVRNVELQLTLTHSFVSDLDVQLISPGGVARMVVMSRVGRKRTGSAGFAADLSGTYSFRDAATDDLWAQAAAVVGGIIPASSYRSTTGGRLGLSNIGGCSTHLNQVFGGLSGTQANGPWTVKIVDAAPNDVGAVTGARLQVDTGADLLSPQTLFAGGFEADEPAPAPVPSSTRGTCREVLFDFTGTGLTSYTVVRNTGGGTDGARTWHVKENDGSTSGATFEFALGVGSDTIVDGDFDGDGIRDAAVWTPATGLLKVRRSSRPEAAPLTIALGAPGDDPRIAGDYDRDEITDFAVHRAGAAAGMPSRTIIRSTRTGRVRSYVTGEHGQVPASGYDLDGDDVANMAMQSDAGNSTARFTIFNGSTGAFFIDYILGTPGDVIVPGTFAGIGVFDMTVIKGSGGVMEWLTRDSWTGLTEPTVIFGLTATDYPLSGDFDGDGLYDHAVWRPGANPGESRFFIRRSLLPDGPVLEVPWGQNGDFPVPNARTH